MNGIWNLAMVLLATLMLSAHPASSVPIRAPLVDPDFIPSLQSDLSDVVKSGTIDLDALSDQLQNILSSQPSASTPTDSVAEAQRRRYWPIVRNFLDQIFSPTDEPDEQPDTTALAENLENALALNADRTSSSQNMPRTQELPLNEQVAKEQWLGTILPIAWEAYKTYQAYRDSQTTESDDTYVQADLGDFNNGGTTDLDALTDQLQNILSSQPSASTPTDSVAEAQRRKYWPIVRNFLDQIFSSTEKPSEQPDTGDEPMARTQLWSSIRNFLGDLFAPKCSDALYIMAFTGGTQNSFTTDTPLVELLVGDEVHTALLPDLPGEDFIANKGDLWRINLSDFGFTDTCITKGDVQKITLVEGGNDGWLIDSVVTFLRSEDSFVLLSNDIDVNRWIDGNGGPELERFSLSIV